MDSEEPEWTIQWGSIENDKGTCVTTDSFGNIYVSGETYEDAAFTAGFIRKFTSTGQLIWNTRFDLHYYTEPVDISVQPGQQEPYVIGYFGRHLQGAKPFNIFTMKFDYNGNKLWFDTLPENPPLKQEAGGIIVDAGGNAYITGFIDAGKSLNKAVSKGVIAGYSKSGNLFLYETFGDDDKTTTPFDITFDLYGNLVIVGSTNQSYDNPIVGTIDTFVFRYNLNTNNFTSQKTFGSTYGEIFISVERGPWGKNYTAGSCNSDFDGHPKIGKIDNIFFRYNPAIEE